MKPSGKYLVSTCLKYFWEVFEELSDAYNL